MKTERDIKFVLIHIGFWLALLAWTIFCYYYPREWAVYENKIDEIFAPAEWFFIWVMPLGLWIMIYVNVTCKLLEDN